VTAGVGETDTIGDGVGTGWVAVATADAPAAQVATNVIATNHRFISDPPPLI
jgi:hypothetical protein